MPSTSTHSSHARGERDTAGAKERRDSIKNAFLKPISVEMHRFSKTVEMDQDTNLMDENAAKERPSWAEDGKPREPVEPLERTFVRSLLAAPKNRTSSTTWGIQKAAKEFKTHCWKGIAMKCLVSQDLTLTLTGDFVDELARGYSQPWFQELLKRCWDECADREKFLQRLQDVAFEAKLLTHRDDVDTIITWLGRQYAFQHTQKYRHPRCKPCSLALQGPTTYPGELGIRRQ